MFHCRRLEHALLLRERSKHMNDLLPIFMLHPPILVSLLLFGHDHIVFIRKQQDCKKEKSCRNANTDTPRLPSSSLHSRSTPLLSTNNNTPTDIYICPRNNHHRYYHSNSNSHHNHHNKSPGPAGPLLHIGLPIQIFHPLNYKRLSQHTQCLKPRLE